MTKSTLPRFEGDVVGLWLREARRPDRNMRLTADFAFIDSRDVRWNAPANRVIDGASIPEFLWSSIFGTPFIGDYRRASVVHDVACDDRTRPHEEVHFMFYEAMICDGVSEEQAMLMYTAVRLFGPKWPSPSANKRAHSALRRFDRLELAKTLDKSLGERTYWSKRASQPTMKRGSR
jgi:hypothetical protein